MRNVIEVDDMLFWTTKYCSHNSFKPCREINLVLVEYHDNNIEHIIYYSMCPKASR